MTFCLLPSWESVIVLFCCTLLDIQSGIAIILMGKRGLVALLILFSWCLEMVEQLFLAVPRGCLRFVIVVFPDHTHLILFIRHHCWDVFFLCVWFFLLLVFCEFGAFHYQLLTNFRLVSKFLCYENI